jgi:hypothetical protein
MNVPPLRVLITGAEGDVGQAAIKSLRMACPHWWIAGVDCQPPHIARLFVDDSAQVPAATSPNYPEKLAELCQTWRIDAVLPVHETEISVLGALPWNGPPLACHPAAAFETCADKLRCYQTLEGHVPLAPFADGGDCSAVAALASHPRMRWPAVRKPRLASGSKGHERIRLEDLPTLQPQPGSVVQSLIDDQGGEFSVGIWKDPHGIRLLAFRRTLGHGIGCTWRAEVTENPAVLDYARRAAEAAPAQGAFNLQMRLSSTGPALLELNMRPSSLAAARAAAGFPDTAWFVLQTLRLPVPEPSPVRALTFSRFFHETIDWGHGPVLPAAWQQHTQTHA